MNLRAKKHGISLTEMVIVVAGVALLAYLTVPSLSSLIRSFDSPASARTLISGALASARAIAAREHRYAGIRFQKVLSEPENVLDAPQYMIFIVHDIVPNQSVSRFRAVEGLEPIRLPDSVGVMDVSEVAAEEDVAVGGPFENATTFSILFSPTGKLVRHISNVRRANDYDVLFNGFQSVRDGDAMFFEDGFWPWPYQPNDEMSRASFVIYDSRRFVQAYRQGRAYSGCLAELVPIYINSYTGTMILGN
jgi:type II secretory pathway pseudopilin PulG